VRDGKHPTNATARRRAWGVHVYTASSAVLALLAVDAMADGRFGAAFAWLAVTMIIDCTDGTLARRLRVKEVLPNFDGAKLDDIMDYLTYVFVPLAIIVRADLLPDGVLGFVAAAAPLLASGYGFCESEAKTLDHFFTGFPSYWNVLALYLYVLDWSPTTNALLLLGFSAAVFVPIRYLYPSRMRTLRLPTYLLGIIWGVMIFWLLAQFPDPSPTLARVTLFFPAYYVIVSLWVHWQTPPSPRHVPSSEPD
jgi:phosphatidylcholine synthase